MRCEHADLLAVVATNQRQQTLATIFMLGILGSVLLVLLCTIIKYDVYLGHNNNNHHHIFLNNGPQLFIVNTVIYTSGVVNMKYIVFLLVENKFIKFKTAKDKKKIISMTYNISFISLAVGGGGADVCEDLCFTVSQKTQVASQRVEHPAVTWRRVNIGSYCLIAHSCSVKKVYEVHWLNCFV